MSTTQPPHLPSRRELRDTLNYTILALVGMLAGFLIGCIYGRASRSSPAPAPTVQTR